MNKPKKKNAKKQPIKIIMVFKKVIKKTYVFLCKNYLLFKKQVIRSSRFLGPIFISYFKALLFILFFLTILVLTYLGIYENLTTNYNDLLKTIASIIGTIVAIFFTLIVLPLQQIAERYSPKFLKFIKRDLKFIFSFFLSIIILIYNIIFIFLGASSYIAIASVLLLVFLLFNLWIFVLHLIKMSNVYYSILLPTHKEIVKTISRAMPRSYRACKRRNKRFLEKDEFDMCHLSVDKKITEYIKDKLLPIREIALKSIRDLDLEMSKNSIHIIMSVVVNYLYLRRKYYGTEDPLLSFIYEEFGLLARSGAEETHLRLHPFLIDCWKLIGIRAADVEVKRNEIKMNEGLNFLVSWPLEALKELCLQSFTDKNSYAPTMSCYAIGDIGKQLMARGYNQQAAATIGKLTKISTLAIENGFTHIVSSANYSIMKIYIAGVLNGDKACRYSDSYSYREINENIKKILLLVFQKKRTAIDNGMSYSFIGQLLDPFEGVNLSRISEFGLFEKGLNEYALKKNLEAIGSILGVLEETINQLSVHKDWYFSDQAIMIIYIILLHILSYINPSMAKDHILFYKNGVLSNDKLKEKSAGIFDYGIKILSRLALNRFDRHMFEKTNLTILFSLFFIVLYENKIKSNKALDLVFENYKNELIDLLSKYKKKKDSDSNDELYKFYRLLKVVLKKNKFDKIDKLFNVPKFEHRSRGPFSPFESSYPEAIIGKKWILKRPGMQPNGYYYNIVEKALKLDIMEFY